MRGWPGAHRTHPSDGRRPRRNVRSENTCNRTTELGKTAELCRPNRQLRSIFDRLRHPHSQQGPSNVIGVAAPYVQTHTHTYALRRRAVANGRAARGPGLGPTLIDGPSAVSDGRRRTGWRDLRHRRLVRCLCTASAWVIDNSAPRRRRLPFQWGDGPLFHPVQCPDVRDLAVEEVAHNRPSFGQYGTGTLFNADPPAAEDLWTLN